MKIDQGVIEGLVAKEQIRQSMARYARGIDRRDEEMVKSVYHPDSVDEHGFGLDGTGWDLAANCRPDGKGFPKAWKTHLHFLGNCAIEVDGDRAVSETYFIAYQIFEDPARVEWSMTLHGRYGDRWERRDEEFKIAYRIVVYDWVRTEPNRTPWPGPDHHVPKGYFGGRPVDLSTTTFGVKDMDDPACKVFESLHVDP